MRLHFLDYNPVDKLADRLISTGSLGDRIKLVKFPDKSYCLRLFNKKNKEVGKYSFLEDNLREELIVTLKLILTPTDMKLSEQNAIRMSVQYSPIAATFKKDSYKNFYKDWRKYVKQLSP